MTEQASYFKLGVFVIIGTALVLTGVMVLGAGAIFKDTLRIETYLEESVQGLDVGAPVKLRGVMVGKVSHIGFVRARYPQATGHTDAQGEALAGYVVVEMDIDLMEDMNSAAESALLTEAVEKGLRARLASAGIMGTVYMELAFLPKLGTSTLEISWVPKNSYVPSTKSIIAELTAVVQRIAGQLENAHVDELVGSIHTLTKSANDAIQQVKVEELQRSAASFIDEVRASNARLKAILDNPSIDSALADAAATAASIKRMSGEGEEGVSLFIKDLPEISNRLRSAASQVDAILADEQTHRMLAKFAETADAASPAADELRQLVRRLDRLVGAQQEDLEAIVTSLRRTLSNVEQLSEDAKKNPSRVIFGDPPPVRPGGTPR